MASAEVTELVVAVDSTQVKAAQEDLKKLGDVAKDTAKEVTAAGNASGASATQQEKLGRFMAKYGGAANDAAGASDKAAGAIGKMGGASDGLLIASRALGATLGIVAVEAFNLARQAANTYNDLSDLSDITGVSVEGLSALKFVANATTTEFSTLTSGIAMMEQRIGMAIEGNKNLQKVFLQLGVTADGGAENLFRLADAVEKAATHEEKLAIVTQALGRSGKELMPVLNEGGKELRALYERGVELNRLTPEMQKKAKDYARDMAELSAAYTGVKITIGNIFLPALQSITGELAEQIGLLTKAEKGWKDYADMALHALSAGADAFPGGDGVDGKGLGFLEYLKTYIDVLREKEELEIKASQRQGDNFNEWLNPTVNKGLWMKVNPDELKPKKGPKDPLESIVDSTLVKRTMEYNKLLERLQSGYGHIKKGSDLYKQSLEKLADQYRDVIEAGDVFGNKSFKTTSGPVAEFIKQQVDDYNGMEGELADIKKQMDDWAKDLMSDFEYEAKKNSSKTPLQRYHTEAEKWASDQMKVLEKIREKIGTTPEIEAMLHLINMRSKQNFEAIMLPGVSETFSQANSVIAAKEQQMQARVVAGLMSETAARVELRKVIGAQGDALTRDLLPEIEKLIETTSDPADVENLRAMVAEIQKMVAIGQQTNWFAGLQYGLREYSNDAVDEFTMVKDATLEAFKGMEDALVEFVTTGKMGFSDLVESILSDLARIAIQKTITAPLGNALSGLLTNMFNPGGGLTQLAGPGALPIPSAQGNMFTGTTGLSDYSNSIVTRPTVFGFAKGIGLMGEEPGAPGEAIMPLTRMSGGDLGVKVQGGEDSQNVYVNIINNASGSKVEEKETVDSRGNRRIEVIVSDMVASEINRRGSGVNKAVGQAFNARPAFVGR